MCVDEDKQTVTPHEVMFVFSGIEGDHETELDSNIYSQQTMRLKRITEVKNWSRLPLWQYQITHSFNESAKM